MAANQHTFAYDGNMSSLKGLEFSCERDEADLSAEIMSLQFATEDGAHMTAAVYEDADDMMQLGNLAFGEYKTDTDEQSLKAIHQSRGDTFLFKGAAYIMGKAVNILAFRER